MPSVQLIRRAALALIVPAGLASFALPAAAEHSGYVYPHSGYVHVQPGYVYPASPSVYPSYEPRRDERPPRIVDLSPANGEQVSAQGRTRIAARVMDRRSGVESYRLRVDGRDVTPHSRFDGEEIRYRENLAPGRHWAELSVRDRAGNVTRQAWSFVVVDDRRWEHQSRPYSYSDHNYPTWRR